METIIFLIPAVALLLAAVIVLVVNLSKGNDPVNPVSPIPPSEEISFPCKTFTIKKIDLDRKEGVAVILDCNGKVTSIDAPSNGSEFMFCAKRVTALQNVRITNIVDHCMK